MLEADATGHGEAREEFALVELDGLGEVAGLDRVEECVAVARERRRERQFAVGGFQGMGAEALAEEESHLPEGVAGSRRFQIRPEDVEEVFPACAQAGECMKVDEKRDWFAGAEYGGIGVGRVQPDGPQRAEHEGMVGRRNCVCILHLTVR
jgi:hypothetical protein